MTKGRLNSKPNYIIAAVGSDLIPVGTILAFAGKKKPKGWLWCRGQNIPSRYVELRRVCEPWGFRAPDFRAGGIVGGRAPKPTIWQLIRCWATRLRWRLFGMRLSEIHDGMAWGMR